MKRDGCRGDAAHGDLPLAADIGQPGAGGEDEAEAHQRIDHRPVQRDRDGVGRSESAVQESVHSIRQRCAGQHDQDKAGCEGGKHRSHRHKAGYPQRGIHNSCPAIRAPMRSR